MNGQSISIPTGSNAWAAIDTGTTGVGVPADTLQAIFAAIPNSQQGSGQTSGYYLYRTSTFLKRGVYGRLIVPVACSTSVTIEVTWGNSSKSWSISPADFALEEVEQGTCAGAFFDIPTQGTSAPPFIFGDTFLVRHTHISLLRVEN